MNRFSTRMVAVALAALLLTSASAFARNKKPKKKKAYDLSANPLANVQSKQPDKELYDKAMIALKKGRFDVARLDLQTMLNTYPDSEYKMRAKLAVGDSWFKEGGTAALTQAEAEYKDFETFFPNAPEAAEAQMKVGDIYYSEMEKPDRDFTNAINAEKEYREMLNMYPDSTLIPRAKQKLRDVQEVLAERETQIGLYYESKENYSAAVARLQTVVDTYPVYSKSDLALLNIGDAYAGEAHIVQLANLSGAVKERMRALYLDKAAAAYAKVITRYPMAPRVEDARDRLVAMNRPIPEPTAAAVAESEAEEQSRQPIRFTDTLWGVIKHGPTTVQAVHVGDPSLEDPKRTLAPDITKQNVALFQSAINAGRPTGTAAVKPTGPNEPPRSDQPSQAPLQTGTPDSTGVGVTIVNAPNSGAAPATSSNTNPTTIGSGPAAPADPNALVKPIAPETTALPAAQAPAPAPDQINDIKPGTAPAAPAAADNNGKKKKAPKPDLSDESSSKKKKKKGLGKLNPF
ncbi:MAG TPA: outer membrane protein assembly factor BamD [Terracidiphilus sp.]|jgi:outer membrane protein assembly factor BamD|nr:outer membrane protein assembly factor BamD [Terracidiphilus sp.]